MTIEERLEKLEMQVNRNNRILLIVILVAVTLLAVALLAVLAK